MILANLYKLCPIVQVCFSVPWIIFQPIFKRMLSIFSLLSLNGCRAAALSLIVIGGYASISGLASNRLDQMKKQDCYKMLYALRVMYAHPELPMLDRPPSWWGDSVTFNGQTVIRKVNFPNRNLLHDVNFINRIFQSCWTELLSQK